MFIVMGAIGIAVLVWGIYARSKRKSVYSDDGIIRMVVGSVIIFSVALAAVCVGCELSGRMVIDDKIALCETQNHEIEEQLNVIVQRYMDYETDFFEKFTGADITAVVSMYPELKSNKLVEKQIETYVSNQSEIKRLRCKKLDYTPYAWWLYFGK